MRSQQVQHKLHRLVAARIRDDIRKTLSDPNWGEKFDGIPGGRDIGKELVEKYYAKNTPSGKYKGCPAYSDFRELLENEKDIDAVKIMTPDHLHGYISVAAMNKGKHAVIHKIHYDASQMKITNDEDANKFLYREYRPGWEM